MRRAPLRPHSEALATRPLNSDARKKSSRSSNLDVRFAGFDGLATSTRSGQADFSAQVPTLQVLSICMSKMNATDSMWGPRVRNLSIVEPKSHDPGLPDLPDRPSEPSRAEGHEMTILRS